MKQIKRTIILLLCCFCITLSFLGSVSFVYADDAETPPINGGGAWLPCNSRDNFVASWKAYCMRRNTYNTNTPTFSSALINWDYDMTMDLCKALNIDMEALQAGLWYRVQNDGTLAFFYNSSAIAKLNQMYSKYVNDYAITPNTVNKQIYSGELFEDDDGNQCLVFFCSYLTTQLQENTGIVRYGTTYKYNGNDIYNFYNQGQNTVSFKIKGSTHNVNIQTIADTYQYVMLGSCRIYPLFTPPSSYPSIGKCCIIKNTSNNNYFIGVYNEFYYGTQNPWYCYSSVKSLYNPTVQNANINANRGEDTETPSGPQHIKTPAEDIQDYLENNYPVQTAPPPTDPYDPNPTGGSTTTDPSGNTEFNWQMPELNIDWDLGDLSHIFPFSIPFDLIDLLNQFDIEPCAPHFEGEIDLIYFTYDLDIDLSYFDDVMEYARTFELILYTLGLILATRGVFKVY